MRAPHFWARPAPWQAFLLFPVALLYDACVRVRFLMTAPYRAPVPVLCIGNFTLGGAGKTPAVIYLALLLKRRGLKPFIVTRGYGGKEQGPHHVEAGRDKAEAVGDEALLHARHAPTIMAKNRTAGVQAAVAQGADVVLLDDGMQNPNVAKTLTLALVDANEGIGNGKVFPAGPLRASLGWQKRLADAVIVLNGKFLPPALRPCRLFQASLQSVGAEWLKGTRVLAFCGIGSPRKFRATLESLGAHVVSFRAFPDHYAYDARDAKELIAEAAEKDLTLVTTEKDLVRLKSAPDTRAQLAGLANAVKIEFAPEDEQAFAALIDDVLSHRDGA